MKRTIFEGRFEEVPVAQAIGDCVAPILSCLEYRQPRPLSSIAQKVAIIYCAQPGDNELDAVDPSVSVVRCHVGAELDKLRQMTRANRMLRVARLTQGSLLDAAPRFPWDSGTLHELVKALSSDEIVLRNVVLGRPKKSPGRQRSATLEFELDLYLIVSVQLVDMASNQEHKIAFARFPPTLGNLEQVGKLTWTSDSELRIDHKNGQDYWVVQVNDSVDTEFHSARASSGDAHALYNLGMMYLKGQTVLPNVALAKYWLQRSASKGFSKAVTALAAID